MRARFHYENDGSSESSDNQNGLLDSITEGELPDGRTISITYDANGNVTSITPPGRPAHEFEYTAINLESKYDPPALSPMPTPAVSDPATYFAYNADGQLTQITRPDGGTITHSYDADSGQLMSKTLPGTQGQLQYSYHPETAASGAGLLQSIVRGIRGRRGDLNEFSQVVQVVPASPKQCVPKTTSLGCPHVP